MKRALFIASACAILAAPAFAQTPSQAPSTRQPSAQAPAAAAPSSQAAPAPTAPAAQPAGSSANATPSAADFVKQAAISGIFEIQSSELALHKHVRPDRTFAHDMIRDHSRIAAQLKHLVRSNHINAKMPTKLDDQHQKMLDQLRGETGATFDKDYDQMQKQGHEQAVSLFKSYAQNGDNPALKNWAAKTLPTLEEHLSMADKLS
jgi:putative membrane protein